MIFPKLGARLLGLQIRRPLHPRSLGCQEEAGEAKGELRCEG
jgi:hypothetical protein